MDAIWQWGIDLIHTIQLAQGPTLTAFFKAVTFMGEEEFFLLLLPLVFWCVDFAVGVRLALAYLLSVYVNAGLKDILAHPRPFELDPTVQLHDQTGYGLPSGHSQSGPFSMSVTFVPFRLSSLAIVAPAAPEPTTATCVSTDLLIFSRPYASSRLFMANAPCAIGAPAFIATATTIASAISSSVAPASFAPFT